MANLMNKTKAQLVERINALEAEKTALEFERKTLKQNVELEAKRVNELNSLIGVKNNGLEEQSKMIVLLNNELSKTNKALDSYKDSLFEATNAVDDYICKLTIARNKNEYEKSLHKYYFAGGVFAGITIYVLLTLLF